MKKASVISVLLILLFCGATPHPIHVSVTEITVDEKERELEIIARIFLDDLETAIRQSKKLIELNLLQPGNSITTDQLISGYLQQHFKILIKGKEQKMKYLGHEVEDEAILCYVQISAVKKIETIEVFNNIITEVHDDQSNLVHVTQRGIVKSLRLMNDNPSGKLTFETK